MAEDEIHEMHERAEETRRDPSLKPVSLTMAVMAVLVATVTLLGHRAHTEAVLSQSRASDQWAYYQAKGIRRHTYAIFADLMSHIATRDPAQATKAQEQYRRQSEQYGEDQKEIEAEARKLENEVHVAERKADRFNLAEVFLEIGLVITSITLLTTNRAYWKLGMLFAAAGVILAATGFLVH